MSTLGVYLLKEDDYKTVLALFKSLYFHQLQRNITKQNIVTKVPSTLPLHGKYLIIVSFNIFIIHNTIISSAESFYPSSLPYSIVDKFKRF